MMVIVLIKLKYCVLSTNIPIEDFIFVITATLLYSNGFVTKIGKMYNKLQMLQQSHVKVTVIIFSYLLTIALFVVLSAAKLTIALFVVFSAAKPTKSRLSCPFQCSSHLICTTTTSVCKSYPKWSSIDCSIEINLDSPQSNSTINKNTGDSILSD
ncbi:hypothetical protein ACTA71_011035 [Dictyostelium dimigraforme]